MPKFFTGGAAPKARERLNNPEIQPIEFYCLHCPFQGCSNRSLMQHLHHHSTKSSFQCCYCTFSVKRAAPLVTHIKRVHPGEPVKYEAREKKAGNGQTVPAIQKMAIQQVPLPEEANNVEEAQLQIDPSIEMVDNTIVMEAIPIQVVNTREAETVGTVKPPELENEMAPAVEVENIIMEPKDHESEAEVMIIEDNPENPWCSKCGKPITDEKARLIQCKLCQNYFHEACGVAHQPEWFCPVCVINESPTKHYAKLIKAVDSFSRIYLGEQVSSGPSTPPPNSDVMEEIQCRKELAQLNTVIQTSEAELAQASKAIKEEARLLRSSKTEGLKKEVDKLNVTNHGLSVQLAFLLESKERNYKEEIEKRKLKLETEEQLFYLREASLRKVKVEVSGGAPSANEKRDGKIQRREILLDQLERELAKIQREVRSLNERIADAENQVAENNKKLAELRNELEQLRDHSGYDPSSPLAAQIKTLKTELNDRKKRFFELQVRLVQLNSKVVIDDILKKQKESLNYY